MVGGSLPEHSLLVGVNELHFGKPLLDLQLLVLLDFTLEGILQEWQQGEAHIAGGNALGPGAIVVMLELPVLW